MENILIPGGKLELNEITANKEKNTISYLSQIYDIDEVIVLPNIMAHVGADAAAVLSKLLPEYIQVQVYNAMLQSAASELGSRMAAMSAATDNATERIADLNLTYNKARQAQVTNEISEIVGGAAALE